MPGARPVRQYALWGLIAFTIATSVCFSPLTTPAYRNVLAAVYNIVALGLVATYVVLYARDRGWPRVQFSIRTILVLVTIAALVAWSWRSEWGPLVTGLIVVGGILYWRIWVRRDEPLSGPGLLLIAILSLFFAALVIGLAGAILFELSREPREGVARTAANGRARPGPWRQWASRIMLGAIARQPPLPCRPAFKYLPGVVRVMRFFSVVALSLVVSAAVRARADDSWPQFRGPDGQGHSDATGLPIAWSESENIAWKTPLPGRGWSSPVIEDGRIWLTTALEDGHKLHAVCVDAASGKVLLDVPVFTVDEPEKINAKNSYASPTPVMDGNRVIVHFGTYGTACLVAHSGQILWTNRELKVDHKEGPGSSPILVGNLVVVNCDGQDVQYVAALDKRSGKIVWKTDRSVAKNPDPDLRKAYSTPLAITAAGREQIISVGAHRASSYDARNGSELWYVDFTGFSNVPRPFSPTAW